MFCFHLTCGFMATGTLAQHSLYKDLLTGMDFDIALHLFVKPRLLVKNVDFSNSLDYKYSLFHLVHQERL